MVDESRNRFAITGAGVLSNLHQAHKVSKSTEVTHVVLINHCACRLLSKLAVQIKEIEENINKKPAHCPHTPINQPMSTKRKSTEKAEQLSQ